MLETLEREAAEAVSEELEAKRAAREARAARERQEAETRRIDVRRQVAGAMRAWFASPLPALVPPVEQIRSALNSGSPAATAAATEQSIFTYILEELAGYAALTRMLNRVEAGFELSAAVRILVCARIIREYGLLLNPVEVAFPTGGRGMLPTAFSDGDPEETAAAVIGMEIGD